MLLSCSAFSQTDVENIKYGDEAFADGDYYTASVFYKNAVDIQKSAKLETVLKYAEALRLYNNYKDAEYWYSFIVSKDKKNKIPSALFWLAVMNKNNGKYAEAKENFKKYTDKNKQPDDYYIKKSVYEQEACDFALQLLRDTLPVKIEHLDNNVNTTNSEFGAVQLGDTALMFSSLRPVMSENPDLLIPNAYASEIYESKSTVAGWALGEGYDNITNSKGYHNANITFTSDHRKYYFSRCSADDNPQMQCEIYKREFKKGRWQEPVRLNNSINMAGYTSTQPFVICGDKNKEVLFFISDRPGGYGNMDIWYSEIDNDKFDEPKNMGSNINTGGNEITPFYDLKNHTLYFSSDWHKGLGGYDIFKSKKDGCICNMRIPENLGYPINTSYNDLYYVINETDTNGYFTSNRPGSLYIKGETCCYDIYSYRWLKQKKVEVVEKEVPKDTVKIEVKIKELLPIRLYFHNDEPDPDTRDTSTAQNYKSTLANYVLLKEKYREEYSKGLKGDDKLKAEQDIEDFFRDYVNNGFEKLQMFTSLLLSDLQRGNSVVITVKGYCSPLTTNEYNINLAKRRISSLKNYISEYENGTFVKYLDGTSADGGKLEFKEEPIGEEQANSLVSDNPNDKRNSIYSRAAALERNIQIILYSSEKVVK